MKRIAIIGGGISGLSAAFHLEQQRLAGASIEYSLYEFSNHFGGVLFSERVDDCLIEAGPDSFISEKSWAADFCRQVGLGDQLIGSNDDRRKTYLLSRGKLVPLPDGLVFMVPTNLVATAASPLFSIQTKLRIAKEWLRPPSPAGGDESVASFIARHYGEEMVERIADPLLAGVYGGDARDLSVRAVLPRFVEMETKTGSLGRGILAARKQAAKSAKPLGSIFTTLKGGMQTLADAIVSKLPEESLHLNSTVQAVQQQGSTWVVSAGFGSDEFDAVILATPTYMAAELVSMTSEKLAEELAAIRYNSSITVGLTYDASVRKSLPPGFGFLIPRSEGRKILAATFVHDKFPGRAPSDRAIIRCFMGGTQAEASLGLSDEQVVIIVRDELSKILGILIEPRASKVYRWKNAMAQYHVGHLERLERVERLLEALPGLALAGNGYRGIGIPDCIRSGQQAAEKVTSDATSD
jgi:protoporphyrinogen/coproporphyrinogen III oxidase